MGTDFEIKIEDGNYSKALWPAVIRCLQDLNVLDDGELKALEKFKEISIKNNINDVVGKVYPIF
ncbi:MAG: hypothetical protein ACI8WT_004118 [Clostridium sp.]|jgi:hypothetical protein